MTESELFNQWVDLYRLLIRLKHRPKEIDSEINALEMKLTRHSVNCQVLKQDIIDSLN